MATPHYDKALAYARDVVKGGVPACKWVKLASQRHLDDLERAKREGFAYEFSPVKAEKICRFISLLPHTKGKWAKKDPANPRAHLITLEPWQCFVIGVPFGWLRRSDGTRRYRLMYVEVPRKNGKSIIAAGIGLYMFCADGEEGAEVYSGATIEKQAWEVFRPAKLMVERSPKLRARFGVKVNAANLHIKSNESKFEPVIGKPGDGASPSCSITDEYHEHATSAQLDTMVTGMGARAQPMAIIITTAGDNIAGPCYDMRGTICKILDGAIQDDEKFGIVYTIDDGDDWANPAILRKANPNFGVSVLEDFLLARQREAVNSARARGRFLTKHLNCWVNALSGYFDMRAWADCARVNICLDDYEGRRIIVGLDLASKIDIASLKILILPEEEGGPHISFGIHYLPEATVDLPENEHYQAWRADGFLRVTDGNIIDFELIEEDILDLASRFKLQFVVYDPHQATYLVTRLQKVGVPVQEYRPLVLNFSEPMKQLDAFVRARQWVHDGCPVMTWMMSNVVSKPDKKGNVYPNKETAEKKIDGPVALISALGKAMAGEEDNTMPRDFELKVW
ncbi:terminase [Niveispirillum cyanobacteriorum]|uniref:Terminase n=1 Tax=Niveispirillum cyanobacteriorum TaxID=1612173 RepID=A0A2K9NKD7_9PROT|nr:terminase [Niveispirillum cyanobacteriorum]